MTELLEHPVVRLALIGVAAILAFVLLLRRSRRGAGAPDKQLEELVRAGKLGDAARLALDRGELHQALELYLRAQQPQNAASVAARLGDHRQAAELYERAGNLERAAHFYDQAGQGPKAAELRGRLPGARAAAPVERGAATGDDAGDGRRGRALEAAWRRQAATPAESDAGRAELQRAARAAADALLADGDLRRAADLYRDAELDDEAIHLYVNVLGEPGQAAAILSRRGNHQRAAELYELAGERERAAAAWVSVAEASPRPEQYWERIEELAPPVAVRYLEREVATRKLSRDTAELYYHFARALASSGDTDRARDTFRELVREVGDYRDVSERIARLGAAVPAGASREAREQAGREPTVPALSEAELQQLASQVVQAAAAQLKRQGDLSAVMASPSVAVRASRTELQVAGLELAPLKVELLFDEAVAAAKAGPGIDTLRRFAVGPCDLQNIEVYYRLGLAHLAAGDWEQALAAFDAVEEASPGYRDAWKRADEIRAWKDALGARVTRLGDAAAAGGRGDGRYQLRGELGRGGMAVVYRAYDTVLGREVALKFLSEELSREEEMRELFQREARSVAALNHPNIVTVHDVGVLEGRAFLCMEFVDGRSVEALIAESPGLTIVESLRIAKQVLDALGYAHRRQIIHRDIKPANMMRTASGLVKLMDFGLAKSTAEHKKTSYIAGTPAYMAPEHLRGEDLDGRADLFAVAVSLYEMLSGELPYAGMDRSSPPVPLDARVPAIPPRLVDAVMKGLALDRRDRWATAEELAQPIAQILDAVTRYAGGGATAPLPGGEAAAPPSSPTGVPTVTFKPTSAPTRRL